jgi:hypothetical protein
MLGFCCCCADAGSTTIKANDASTPTEMLVLVHIVDLLTRDCSIGDRQSADAPWGVRITHEHPSYWLGCVGAFLSSSMT